MATITIHDVSITERQVTIPDVCPACGLGLGMPGACVETRLRKAEVREPNRTRMGTPWHVDDDRAPFVATLAVHCYGCGYDLVEGAPAPAKAP
jgi:hypothetical protein